MDKMDFFAAAAESALFAGSKAFVFFANKVNFSGQFPDFSGKILCFQCGNPGGEALTKSGGCDNIAIAVRNSIRPLSVGKGDNTMGKSYDSFLFDLYGTLVDIHTDEEKDALWEACARELKRQGITARPDSLREQYTQGVRELETRDRLTRGPGAEIDLEPVFRRMLEAGGKEASAEQVRDFAKFFRMASLEKLRLFPGAAELLKAIHRAGKRAYLLSNAQSLFTRPELDRLELTELFDGILLSSEVGFKKPDPQFYRAMLDKYSLDPARTVMIGNDDEADCWGAAAVGLDSCYVATEQSPELTRPLPENCTHLGTIADAMALV